MLKHIQLKMPDCFDDDQDNGHGSVAEKTSELALRPVAKIIMIFIALANCHTSTCIKMNRIKSQPIREHQTHKRNIISTYIRHERDVELAVPIGKPKVKIKDLILVYH